jgi:Carboxypeptidase regulatory-like domain
VLLKVVFGLSVLAGGVAQTPPPREAQGGVRPSAVLSGTVVSDDGEAVPVRHVRVTCTGAAELMTVTDDRGRFTFARLPAGRYTIRMTKAGWVPAMYGAKGPLRPGTPIPIADGQTLEIVARLPRGAVITGAVIDESGQPSIGTTVRAMRSTVQNGERRLVTFGSSGTTDDRGVYRIFSLPAGDYIVGAAARSTAPAPPGADVRLTTDLDVHHARTAAPQVPPPPDRGVAFSSTFFPGTPLAAQASRISLRTGEERGGIDFALQLVPTARVEGSVYSPEGAVPAGTQVTLLASGQTAFPDVPFDGLRTTGVAADGAFSFGSVAPGQYTLLARSPTPLGWAASNILVDGDRVSGVSLSLQPGMTLSGSVSFDGDRLRPPSDLKAVRVALRPVQAAGMVSIAPQEVTADASGRFTIAGITPGQYQLQATFPGAGPSGGSAARPARSSANAWSLRSASIGRQDTLDVPVALQPGQPIPPAAIVFTDRTATLTGTLQNAASAPSDYTVVLFPADQSLWLPRSRRIDGVSPSADGTFAFRSLVAGEYLLAVVDDAEPGEWFDPAFLQRIAPGALRISIADGEQKIRDLRAGRN